MAFEAAVAAVLATNGSSDDKEVNTSSYIFFWIDFGASAAPAALLH